MVLKADRCVLAAATLTISLLAIRLVGRLAAGHTQERIIYTVDLQGALGTAGLQLAVAAGLLNRLPGGPLVFPKLLPNDDLWIATLASDFPATSFVTVSASEIVQLALQHGVIQASLGFSDKESWSFANVVTLSGLHAAWPIADSAGAHGSWDSPHAALFAVDVDVQRQLDALPQAVNVSGKWSNEVDATRWALDNIWPSAQATTRLVVAQRPELLGRGFLADFAVQQSVFAFWLPDMCTHGSQSSDLWNAIARKAHAAGQMLTVLGYFPDQEVVAACSTHHTEVALVSDFSSSLSFWSRVPPLAQPCHADPAKPHDRCTSSAIPTGGAQPLLSDNRSKRVREAVGERCNLSVGAGGVVLSQLAESSHPASESILPPQPPPSIVHYNPDNTYVVVIVSDGDNLQMAFNPDRTHMDERVALCSNHASPDGACPPLSWTISNRLATFAPYVLQWFYRQAARTGRDSFLLGPSGAGFLHPSLIPAADPLLQRFVNSTLDALALLSASAYVHWDEYDNAQTSSKAQTKLGEPLHEAEVEAYVMRFQGTGTAVFSPITPLIPAWVGDVPTFAEWFRWFGDSQLSDLTSLLVQDELRGQLGYVYMIVDVDMTALGTLTSLLSQHSHVHLVGYRELISLAHQKHELQGNQSSKQAMN